MHSTEEELHILGYYYYYLLYAGFLFGLHFYPKDEGDIFSRSID
jgi:hypothetical protein